MTWYEVAFRKEYLDVYAHRDTETARREASFAAEVLGLPAGARVLDVACGSGMHLRGLKESDLRPVGLDLSRDLLAEAAGTLRVRGDMRALPFTEAFAGATSFFTSFGYFDDAGNRAAVAAVVRALRPHGRLFLDYLNATLLQAILVPETEEERGETRYRFQRRIEDGRVHKEVASEGPEGRRTWAESVQLYGHGELVLLLQECGLVPVHTYGDFDGRDFTTDCPRCIVVAYKA